MNDLESRLSRLPVRSAPAEWRLQILAAAQVARPPERLAPWWLRWLTPPRLALGAAWLLILGLWFSAPDETGRGASTAAPGLPEFWVARQQMLARLLSQPAAPEAEPHFPHGCVFPRRPDQFV